MFFPHLCGMSTSHFLFEFATLRNSYKLPFHFVILNLYFVIWLLFQNRPFCFFFCIWFLSFTYLNLKIEINIHLGRYFSESRNWNNEKLWSFWSFISISISIVSISFHFDLGHIDFKFKSIFRSLVIWNYNTRSFPLHIKITQNFQ